MAFQILTTTAASIITELKRDQWELSMPEMALQLPFLTVMNRLFYCVPPALYAHLMDILEDEELGRIDERARQTRH